MVFSNSVICIVYIVGCFVAVYASEYSAIRLCVCGPLSPPLPLSHSYHVYHVTVTTASKVLSSGGGGWDLPPKTLQLPPPKVPTVVQITIEKALLKCQVNLEWSKMASDTTLYNLKTQMFPGGACPKTPSVKYLFNATYVLYISAPPYSYLNCMCFVHI